MKTTKKKFQEFVFLSLIFLLALFLRVYGLAKYPCGFTPDEAAQGYTAYSLLRTGRDEWGVKLPLSPRSFGDFKAPLYTYLAVLSVGVWGLNEFAVRLPNAFLNSLTVLVVYFLVKKLFTEDNLGQKQNQFLALAASLLLAINPWHISLSRGAFEANLSSFFLPLGVWLFLEGLEQPWVLVLSSLIFGLNLFTYHSAKMITPLVIFFLLIWKRKTVWRIVRLKKMAVATALLIFLTDLILVAFGFLYGAGTRVRDIGIFSGGGQIVADRQYLAIISGLPKVVSRAFNNKVLFALEEFVNNYFSYISPQFLFVQGAGEATYGMIPGVGLLYLWESASVLYAFYLILKEKSSPLLFLGFWVLTAPFPASLSRGVGFHANRVAVMMPAIQIISAYGLIKIFNRLRKIISFRFLVFTFCLLLFFSFFHFLEIYFYQAPKINAPKMFYGWRETSQFLRGNEDKYQMIVFSKNFSEPQAYLMFYLSMNPLMVQAQTGKWRDYENKGFLFVDQLPEYNLGKFVFRNFHFPEDKKPGILFVGREEDFNGVDGKVEKVIYYPGPEKRIAFKLVSFN